MIMKCLHKLFKKYYSAIFIIHIILILTSLGLGENLEKIEIGEISAFYNTLTAVMPDSMVSILEKLTVPLIILLPVSLVLYFWKKTMIVLCHSSFAIGLAPLSTATEADYRIKKVDVNLTSFSYPDNLPEAISVQDSAIKEFISKKGEYGYYGIAHTPFIFRAGYMFGDQRKIHLFHRRRSNDADFEEWDSSGNTIWETSFKEVKEENKSCKSSELIVAISTSFEIKDIEIASISNRKCHVVKFQMQTLNFDIIGNYNQAEILRKQILDKIREIVKRYDIRRIHMAISSSVAFTFFLGMAFSPQHEPDVIVYHYENGKYIWGIDMKKSGMEAIKIPQS